MIRNRNSKKSEQTVERDDKINLAGSTNQLAMADDSMLARALDQLDLGIILTDSNARVLHCNQYTNNILNSRTGLIAAVGTRLKATGDEDTTRLQEYIKRAASEPDKKGTRHHHFAMVLPANAKIRSQYIIIAGLSSSEKNSSTSDAGAVVFVTQRSPKDRTPERILKSLFNLTTSEAKLTTHILESQGIAVAAERSSMGINTARTHLKRIFVKTETSRQAALVRLILKTVGFVRF